MERNMNFEDLSIDFREDGEEITRNYKK